MAMATVMAMVMGMIILQIINNNEGNSIGRRGRDTSVSNNKRR